MTASQDALAAAFDDRSTSYQRDDWHRLYAERLVELAAPKPGMKVLDAATGTGFAALAAARSVGPTGNVVGVDISGRMLEQAKRALDVAALSNVELINADASTLDQYPDSSFDLVICSAGLLYMDTVKALREWHRLVVPGGRVTFSTMCSGFPIAARVFRELAQEFGLSLVDPASPLGTIELCRQALCDAGFAPADPVVESITFSQEDLENAWPAHIRGAHHQVEAHLTQQQLHAFEHRYTSALSELLATNKNYLCNADVIYAFGSREI